MDDRTPYEKAAGLDGQELAEYRHTKMVRHVNDPEFWICPGCKRTLIGKAEADVCGFCRQEKRDAEIKAWKDAEHKRADAKIPAGGLIDKVRAARKEQDEPERSGRERAYPND